MVEAGPDVPCQRRVGHHLRPVQQQVVVVEYLLLLLLRDVCAKQLLELLFPGTAPGIAVLQHLAQRGLAVDHARIDRKAGALQREAVLGRGETQLLPHKAHQVFRIRAVLDREGVGQADAPGVVAQQAGPDAVEGAGPRQRRRSLRAAQAQRLVQHAAHAPLHLDGRTAGEGQQQDALRVGPGEHQAGDARRQGQGLSRPCAGDDE